MKSIYWTLVALFLVLSPLAVQSTSAATPPPSPTIILSPTFGIVGTSVTVTGSGYSANTTISAISISGGTIATQTCTTTATSATGAFSCTFTVPADTAGAQTVTVSGSDIGTVPVDVATATFTVTPSIALTPSLGLAETRATVAGAGFAPNSTVRITFDNRTMATDPATVTTSTEGNFSATFVVPSSTVPPKVAVQQLVFLAGGYSVFSLDVRDHVGILVNVTNLAPSSVGPQTVTATDANPDTASATFNSSLSLAIETWLTPRGARALGTEQTTTGTKNINISSEISFLAPARVVEPWTLYLNIPGDVNVSASMLVTGAYTGSSIFWKDQVQVYPVVVLGPPGLVPNYTLTFSVPCSSAVKQIVAQNFQYTTTAGACPHTISGSGSIPSSGFIRASVTVLYQYALWDPVAWGLVGFAVVFLLVLPNRRVRDRLPKGAPLVAGLVRTLRKVWAALGRLDSHKFLSIFIIISVVMLSFSFMAGPDPRVKVFVIASGTSTKEIRDTLTQSLGNVQILTPSDTVSEFNTMATLGTVQVVVISDYDKLDVASVQKYIVESLNLVPLTIILDNAKTTPQGRLLVNDTDSLYAAGGLQNQPISTLNSKPLTISDLSSSDIKADILRIVRPNSVGLSLGVTSFELVAAAVGLLSMLLVTFGIAFLVSKLIEIGGKPLTSSLVEGVFYSAGVFFFTQAIYMSSSALLGWPLGLHAVTSGSAQLTVLGLFHLGAGNQPRTLAAVIGLVIGAAPAMWPKMDKYIIVAVGALAFFIVADPLTGGTVFYEFALLLTGGPQIGLANSTMISVKSFLNQIGSDAAGWISGNFGISSGEMFYYLGAVPLALVAKLQRSTATLVLLFCGFAACDGIVRVAEMTAYKTEPSMVAGVLSGLVIAVAFLGVSRVESLVRHHFPSRR